MPSTYFYNPSLKLFAFIGIFLLASFRAQCQDIDFNTVSIADNLRKNANSVVRFNNTAIDMDSPKSMRITKQKAITVLNERGHDPYELVFHYDKSNSIKKLRVYFYDEAGNEIKKIKEKDFRDISAYDGISLFNDGRVKFYKYTPVGYPYTVYYEYEYESGNTAFIPTWRPVDDHNRSVEISTYRFSYPTDIKLQKLENNLADFNIAGDEQNGVISYSATDIPAIEQEDYSPPSSYFLPKVKLAVNKFRLEGVDGRAETWQEFGKWMYENLIVQQMDLPESTKNKIKQMVAGVKEPVERAKIVYGFVQNKTRYISVQVGIGGWMPTAASEVDKLSYGDCKGLTNYTKALMDEAGVESYYTAVYADNPRENIARDLVSVQGNHVFLYIPNKEEDIWLECTSQTVPFGYKGTFTDDRDVLVITPEGGYLKNTGKDKIEDNLLTTTAAYSIDARGKLSGDVTIVSKGIQYSQHFRLEDKPKLELEKHYKNKYWDYINNLQLQNTGFDNDRDNVAFAEKLVVSATNYATKSGDDLIFTVNAFNRLNHVPKRYRNRKLPLYISRGYTDEDHFTISIPEGYKIQQLPKPIHIETPYGWYRTSFEQSENNKIEYKRAVLIKNGLYKPEDYGSYRDFRKQIAKKDNTKIVLTKA